tara:strand:+ start:519 stop:1076 length:558 start_codon:yes stop_codon:yes gene_type:complete
MQNIEERLRSFRDKQRRDTANQLNTNITRISRPFSKIPPVATHEQPDDRPVTLFMTFTGDFSQVYACDRSQRYFNTELGLTTQTFAKMYKPYILRSAEAAYEGTSLHRVRPAKDQMAMSSCSVMWKDGTFERTKFAVCFIMIDNLGEMLDQSIEYNHNGYEFKFSDLSNGAGTLTLPRDLQNQTG